MAVGVSGKKIVLLLYGGAIVLCSVLLIHGLIVKRHPLPESPPVRALPG